MHRVKTVRYVSDYKLEIEFTNGVHKIVDLASHLDGEVFGPLKDKTYFAAVAVHPEIETIVWDNGADFSPEFLYEIGKEIQHKEKPVDV